MVTHFKKIPGHKAEVLSLYKTLVRHAKFIHHLDPPPRINLINNIQYEFRHNKGLMTGPLTKQSIDKGYVLEEQLREIHATGNTEPIKDLLNFPPPEPKMYQGKGQTPRRPVNEQSVQDLDKQREGSYIHQYIKYEHRKGLLPPQNKIDPEILETIIKPEALFKRAKLDIRIAEQKIARGPYRIHEARTGPVRFVRTPGTQKPAVTEMIRRQKALTELVGKLEPPAKEVEVWCNMETAWEIEMKKLDPKHEVNYWYEATNEYVREKQNQLNELNKNHVKFSDERIPAMIAKQQVKSDQFHEKYKERFTEMILETNGVTAHDDLLGQKPLSEIVHEHKFETR